MTLQDIYKQRKLFIGSELEAEEVHLQPYTATIVDMHYANNEFTISLDNLKIVLVESNVEIYEKSDYIHLIAPYVGSFILFKNKVGVV